MTICAIAILFALALILLTGCTPQGPNLPTPTPNPTTWEMVK